MKEWIGGFKGLFLKLDILKNENEKCGERGGGRGHMDKFLKVKLFEFFEI